MNEEHGIQDSILRVREAIESLGATAEILVCDNSTDRTPEIAREMGAEVTEPATNGYGSAYRHGFDRARGEYIVIGDGDGTYDFSELPRLLEELEREDADMVLGTRLRGDIRPGAMPKLHQYVGNPLLTKVLVSIYQMNISDAHSGFRVIRREALNELNFETSGMEFASEMLVEAWAKELNVREVPITYHKRKGEATLESFSDGWRHLKFLLLAAPYYYYLKSLRGESR